MEKKKTGLSELLLRWSVAISMAMGSIIPAFAKGDEIPEKINGGLKHVYEIIQQICLPVAAVALAACGITMIWGNEKSSETAKKTCIRIIIAIAIIYFAPFLIETVSKWFEGTSTSIW